MVVIRKGWLPSLIIAAGDGGLISIQVRWEVITDEFNCRGGGGDRVIGSSS